MYTLKFMMKIIINYIVIVPMRMVYAKHYYKPTVFYICYNKLVIKGRIFIQHVEYYEEIKEINE